MKRLITIGGLVLTLAVLACVGAFGGSAATAHHPVRLQLRAVPAALRGRERGVPERRPVAVDADHRSKDPVSIFGGFGGLGEAGVATVNQRYQLAAGAFLPSGAEVDFQYLVKDVRGKLAYTVAIERSNVLYRGQTERQPQVLRVTMIFRFDRGAWKIVHRHADTMVALQLPGT